MPRIGVGVGPALRRRHPSASAPIWPLPGTPVAGWLPERETGNFANLAGVNQLTDQTGNGCHITQSNVAKQPLFMATASPGGNPLVQFDGISKAMNNLTVDPFANFTVVLMLKWNSVPTAVTVAAASDTSGAFYFESLTGGFNRIANQSVHYDCAADTNIHLMAFKIVSTAASYAYDSVWTPIAGYAGTTNSSGICLGGLWNGTSYTNYANCSFAGGAMYAGALSDSDLAKWVAHAGSY